MGDTLDTIKRERVQWIDLSKGIAIILVVLGHTVRFDSFFESITRGLIFSFHMPLFFILSCVTYKLSSSNEEFVGKTEKAFKHLIIPAIVLYCLITVIVTMRLLNDNVKIDWRNYLAERINIFVFSSGVDVNIAGAIIPAIGVIWFFFALFFGRTLFDYMHLKISQRGFVVSIIFLTLIGVCCGRVQWLPLSLDIAFAILPFFYFGNWFKVIDIKKNTMILCLLFFIVWIGSFIVCYYFEQSYMELAIRRYTWFPFFYLTAISGTLFVGYLSQLICRFRIMKPLIYLGRNSMYMLWVHIMDWYYIDLWEVTSNNIVNAGARIGIDLIAFCMLMFVMRGIKKHNDSRRSRTKVTT